MAIVRICDGPDIQVPVARVPHNVMVEHRRYGQVIVLDLPVHWRMIRGSVDDMGTLDVGDVLKEFCSERAAVFVDECDEGSIAEESFVHKAAG